MSYSALDFWYESIKKSSSEDIVIYLLGNKSDLALEDSSLRKVSKESAIEFVKRNNIYHWTECSAKSNINIKDTFKSFYKSKSNIYMCMIYMYIQYIILYIDVYTIQKNKLEEKTSNMKKLLEQTITSEPKSQCC
jgi:hypothetical protein